MRKSHQAWFAMFSSQTDSATTDQGHNYFIKTLETVMEVLRPNMSEAYRSKPAHNDVEAKDCRMTNMFETLTVEEPSEADDLSSGNRKRDAAKNITVTISDVDGEAQEAFIASVYLSRDSHRFVEEIRDVWTWYQQGHVSLMAAALTTNTAIEFCRRLQEEFEEMFPKQDRLHELGCLYCVYLRATSAGGQDYESTVQRDTCFTAARDVLLNFTNEIKDGQPGMELEVDPQNFPLYIGENDRSSIDDDERFEQDYDLAFGILPEFFALIQAESRVRAEHEIFRGLRHLEMHKEPPFWLTFGLQVYLEMRHRLQRPVSRCSAAQSEHQLGGGFPPRDGLLFIYRQMFGTSV